MSSPTITLWVEQGYLHRVLPGVYAVGHAAPSVEADLVAALLYAGPGAMLSHATAAWWLGLIGEQPAAIHLSTPRRCGSLPGIAIHERRSCDRIWHKRLPITTVPRTLLDVASIGSLRVVRQALANADYQRMLDIAAVLVMAGRGRPGSVTLRAALEEHQPRLAQTKSQLEVMFFELCEGVGLPLPELNARVNGWEVDALWRYQRVAVELDGYRNHRSPAQVKRDRRKDVALRSGGFAVLRYSDEQIVGQRTAVIADLALAGVVPSRGSIP